MPRDFPPGKPRKRRSDKGGGKLGTAKPPMQMVIASAAIFGGAILLGVVLAGYLVMGHLTS